jgi:hypothetical protein
VVDSLAHLIPIITVSGIRGRSVLRSAEFTRSLLTTSCAILAGLLPVTFESGNSVSIQSSESRSLIRMNPISLVHLLSGATGIAG